LRITFGCGAVDEGVVTSEDVDVVDVVTVVEWGEPHPDRIVDIKKAAAVKFKRRILSN
jgi:hypothetical protein